MFGTSTSSLSVHDELFQLRQVNRNIHEYTTHFRTLAASSGWNETALLSAYRCGLNPKLRQQMSIFENAVRLESFLLKAQHVSQHLCAVSTEEITPSYTSPTNDSPNHEAKQTDQYHLSATERQCGIRLKLCLYCGEEGHLLQTCPVRPPRPVVSTIQINTVINNPRFHDAVLIHANQSFPVKILFDSGSSGNFLSSRLLSVFNIPRQRSPTCYQITTIQGESLGNGLVWCKTPELTLRIGCLHEETLTLLVLEESAIDVVLRRPWMAEHQPTIRWSSGDIEKWSTYCLQHCLRSLPVPPQRTAILGSTTVESLEIASRVDLLPGTKLPKGSLPIVDPGAQGHGGVHQGSIATGVHLTIHLSDGFQFYSSWPRRMLGSDHVPIIVVSTPKR